MLIGFIEDIIVQHILHLNDSDASCIDIQHKSLNVRLTFPLPDLPDFVLVVGVVRVPRVEEVELGVAQLILPDTRFKLRPISGYEACCLVNNVYMYKSKKSPSTT